MLRRTICWAALLAAVCLGQQERWVMLDGLAPFYDLERAPPRSWAMPFSHIDTLEPPYVNQAHLDRSLERLDGYAAHAAKRGYNALWLGNLIHLASFDGVRFGGPVYAADSPFRARAEAYSEAFQEASARARVHGLRFVVETDFPAWTDELHAWLGPEGSSLNNPRLWEAWRAAIVELFDSTAAAGLIVRVGEGGGAYNETATGYHSGVAVTSVVDTQRAIEGLLSIVEDYNRERGTDKRLLFRTWTIGIGEIGALHTSPELYEQVFAPFYGREALMTLIKHVAMDFFCHVPPNPTIGVGELAQVVELQARREYEGFGLFPNYRAASFAAELASYRTQPGFAGISVWATNGGFLFPARRVYAPDGEPWIDSNVHAYGALMRQPDRHALELATAWAAEHGLTSEDAARLAQILLRSASLVARGLYIVPYATRAPALFGLEVFPSQLWLYWTRVISAYGVQGLIAHYALADLPQALADGEWAVAEARALATLAGELAPSTLREQLLGALAFQTSQLQLLARTREVFLHHQHWARRGDAASYAAWRAGLPGLQAALTAHEQAYAGHPRLPALELAELRRELRDAGWIPKLRLPAALLAAMQLCLFGLLLQGLRRRARRGLLRLEGLGGGLLLHGVSAGLLAAGVVVLLCGWRVHWVRGLVAGTALLGSLLPAVLARLLGDRGTRGRGAFTASAALLAPSTLLCALALAAFAWRGPALLHLVYVEAALSTAVCVAVVLGLACLVVGQLVVLVLVVRRSCRPGRRLVVGALAALLLSLGPPLGFYGFGPVRALLALNEAARIGPTILGEAGTGVAELLE